jgi:uncharacterized protein YcbK (DUF882 family)
MKHNPDRRRFLACAAAALPLVAAPGLVLGARSDARRLRFLHTHTGEKLEVIYHESGAYVPDALDALNHLMRDFRSDEITSMDPALLDFLHTAQQRLGSHGTFEIISAYRSPATNEMLRRRGGTDSPIATRAICVVRPRSWPGVVSATTPGRTSCIWTPAAFATCDACRIRKPDITR